MMTQATLADRLTLLGGIDDTDTFQYRDVGTGVVTDSKPVCVLAEDHDMAVAMLLTTAIDETDSFRVVLFTDDDTRRLGLVTSVYTFISAESGVPAWMSSNTWYVKFLHQVREAFQMTPNDAEATSLMFMAAIRSEAFQLRNDTLTQL